MRLDIAFSEVDEPYDAMVQLCRRPLFYSALILSLNSLYREELQIISAVKKRFSHVEVWLSDTDGRQAALAEAMRLGADGLVAPDGLHRIAAPAASVAVAKSAPPSPVTLELPSMPATVENPASSERMTDPLLTAEELRALLQESPARGEE
jgi:DNA-binding NarL/FixJ family response regulator